MAGLASNHTSGRGRSCFLSVIVEFSTTRLSVIKVAPHREGLRSLMRKTKQPWDEPWIYRDE
jgi:hypothetical protein